MVRQAPRVAAPRAVAPRVAAPQRRAVAPRIAAPRSAPAVQRAPAIDRAAIRQQRIEQRVQRREQIIQQRAQRREQILQQRQQAQQPSTAPAQSRAAPTVQQNAVQSTEANQNRLQTLQSRRGQLSRTERRELRELRRAERLQQQQQQQKTTDVQQNAAQAPNAARLNAQQSTRLQQLQQQRQQGRLTRDERRELRQLRQAERRQSGPQQAAVQANPQRLQELKQLAQQGRLTREQRRELRQLQRAERMQANSQQQQQRIAAQQAQQSRFASAGNRRGARHAARAAWRLGLLASFVPWFGPVYWPYAYDDIFYFAFWPGGYEPVFWAYAYDDFFDGIFFPYGAPYANYAYDAPYEGPYARGTVGAAPSRGTLSRGSPSRPATASTREFCAGQANSVTGLPFAEIERAVQPNAEQRNLLGNLRKAAAEAAATFKEACPENVPMTPPGRLQAMVLRLQATQDAVKTVRPAMEAFYNSLSDEQKGRFNEVGPQLTRQRTASRQQPEAQADCSAAKAGLSNLAVERIEELVQPTDAQNAALDRLDDALQTAVDTLTQACPTTTPLTPVGRMEVMEKRLDAMIAAASAVRPALDDFYASLSSEQKAKFNRMGRDTAQAGR